MATSFTAAAFASFLKQTCKQRKHALNTLFTFLERPSPLEHKKLMFVFMIMIMRMILMSPVGTKLYPVTFCDDVFDVVSVFCFVSFDLPNCISTGCSCDAVHDKSKILHVLNLVEHNREKQSQILYLRTAITC